MMLLLMNKERGYFMNTYTLFRVNLKSVKEAVGHLDIGSELDFHRGFFVGSVDPSNVEKAKKFIECAENGKIGPMNELTEIGDLYSLLVRRKNMKKSYLLLVMMYPQNRLGLQELILSRKIEGLSILTKEPSDDKGANGELNKLTKVRWFEIFKFLFK